MAVIINFYTHMTTVEKSVNKGFFQAVFDEIISVFPERSREVAKLRYGIDIDHSFTLEEIGQKYQITRERVRQIIGEALKKIRNHKEAGRLSDVKEKIVFTLKQKNGIMQEEEMINILGGNSESEKGAISFFLDIFGEIAAQEIPGEMKRSRTVSGFNLEQWKSVMAAAKKVLAETKKPMAEKELIKKVLAQEKLVDAETFRNYLAVSAEIKKNNFEKWGMIHWKEVTPKGTREKAHLVLSEMGKPLHFREIAKRIDMYKLGKKPAHPQTVHNELIKDERFVLVGRGIYALSEWGYKRGTVKDVLEDILKGAQSPLAKDVILDKVLNIRKVKKSTIIINLNSYFEKVGKDAYTVKR